MSPKRPMLRYHGGKWLLAPWIIGHFPKHKVYVEPFGGAASVLLRKEVSHAEVYNDLWGEIVNVFRVARNVLDAEILIHALEYTPFSRKEFELSYEPSDDPIEQARRTITRAYMGYGSAAATKRVTGFRANSSRSGTTPARDWVNYAKHFRGITERLKGVVIENRPAVDVMKQHDDFRTLHYVDPPYVHSTRAATHKKQYQYEMTDDEHCELLQELKQLNGMVILSGYDTDMYHDMLPGWTESRREALADGAKKRVEVLWISPTAKKQATMFPEGTA